MVSERGNGKAEDSGQDTVDSRREKERTGDRGL